MEDFEITVNILQIGIGLAGLWIGWLQVRGLPDGSRDAADGKRDEAG